MLCLAKSLPTATPAVKIVITDATAPTISTTIIAMPSFLTDFLSDFYYNQRVAVPLLRGPAAYRFMVTPTFKNLLEDNSILSSAYTHFKNICSYSISYTTVLKYSIVLTSPSCKAIVGSQSSSFLASSITGLRCVGSSCGSGI